MASLAAVSAFAGVKLSGKVVAPATASRAVARMPAVRASASSDAFGKALVAGAGSLLLVAASASAATVKMGGDDGALGFFPAATAVKAGETITFTNNKAFPHNVVFDEDAVPAGVKVDDLSHEEYLNAPGESFTVTFKTPGTYEYYCEPHQGAGMKGTVTVS